MYKYAYLGDCLNKAAISWL